MTHLAVYALITTCEIFNPNKCHHSIYFLSYNHDYTLEDCRAAAINQTLSDMLQDKSETFIKRVTCNFNKEQGL